MVWLVIGGPLTVVVASLATAVIAYKGGKDVDGADGVADATTGRITFSFASQKSLTGWSFTLRCLDANGLQLMDAARAK